MKLFSIIATFALPLVVNAAASPDASDMMLGNNDEVLVERSKSFRKGAAICTYAPNTECFPDTNGFPPCCSTLGGDCKDGARTPSDIACPASVCTNHGIGCYTNKGRPSCCTQNGGSGCTFYDNLSCDVPLSPAPTPSRSPPGADVCTLPPNTNCYKRKGGYPRCCFTTKTCIQQGFTTSSEYIVVK